MAAMTIDLPEDVRESIKARAAASGYTRVEDYVRDMIVAGLGEPISKELEELLLRRLDQPGRVMTHADWEEQKRKLIEWHARECR